jgi:hypothetical protein
VYSVKPGTVGSNITTADFNVGLLASNFSVKYQEIVPARPVTVELLSWIMTPHLGSSYTIHLLFNGDVRPPYSSDWFQGYDTGNTVPYRRVSYFHWEKKF